MRTVLGLDLGTSSVGWALFVADDNLVPTSLIDLGVRHFEEVVTDKTKDSTAPRTKNMDRRTARGTRRNIRRRRQRLDNLLSILRSAGLSPQDQHPFARNEDKPNRPYELRDLALREPLSPFEIGRALYHLARRRGFKSNRGAKLAGLREKPELRDYLRSDPNDGQSGPADANKERQKEESATLEAIESLKQRLAGRTLGQYLWEQLQAGEKVRGIKTSRSDYEDEFERIWASQARFQPNLLTTELKARIQAAIFNQRPLKPPRIPKGQCSLEPTKKRAERAQLIAQRFRYWQDLANIKLTNPETRETCELSPAQKATIAAELDRAQNVSWPRVLKLAGLKGDWTINLEKAKSEKGLKGNRTWHQIHKTAPELWDALTEAGREELVEIILTTRDRAVCYNALSSKYGLDPKEACDLAVLELEAGTASLSAKAMRKMLPLMQQGLGRSEAQAKAGYKPWEQRVPTLSELPPPSKTDFPSPRVRKALGQTRAVANAVARRYGKPTVIRIEMARAMSLDARAREKLTKANKRREKENDDARETLRAWGIDNPSRRDIIWYRLAKQCNFTCPYSRRAIGQGRQSMEEFDIEHIVPFGRSLDSSFNNLTLCDPDYNRRKGDHTPYEAFGGMGEWKHMLSEVSKWMGDGVGKKRRLFECQEPPDVEKMASRQLNETAWICRAAAGYLRQICDIEGLAQHLAKNAPSLGEDAKALAEKLCVETTKGQATTSLTRCWGLMEAIPGHEGRLKTRDDLRHHAVDAVAVAFTTRSLFQQMTRATKGVRAASKEEAPAKPKWLHDAICERLSTMIISQETTRGIRGAFHEDTVMGLRKSSKRPGVYHFRKPLVELSKNEIEAIADPKLRDIVRSALEASGNPKTAFAEGLVIGRTRDGTEIRAKRARITKPIPKAKMLQTPEHNPAQYRQLGNCHHLEVFEDDAGKRSFDFVSTLDAAKRARIERSPIVRPCSDKGKLSVWLARNDTIFLPGREPFYFSVAKFDATNERFVVRPLNCALPKIRDVQVSKGAKFLKIEVDPLGHRPDTPEGTD